MLTFKVGLLGVNSGKWFAFSDLRECERIVLLLVRNGFIVERRSTVIAELGFLRGVCGSKGGWQLPWCVDLSHCVFSFMPERVCVRVCA